MMDRTTRPLVIVAAFAGSLVVGLLLMLWALGGRSEEHTSELQSP